MASGQPWARLSETRWRYATARRVYYVKQLKAPDEDRSVPGLYRVNGGGDVCVVSAGSVEQLASDLRQSQPPATKADPAPW